MFESVLVAVISSSPSLAMNLFTGFNHATGSTWFFSCVSGKCNFILCADNKKAFCLSIVRSFKAKQKEVVVLMCIKFV